MDKDFKSKVEFIVETDGLLKDYLEMIVIKNIKAEMVDDALKSVNSNQVHAALILKNIAPCTLKKFAATIRTSVAAASALIDRMVRDGLVCREINPESRREVLLRVSPEFEAHVTHVRAEMTLWFEQLAGKIGMKKFEEWHGIMVSLNQVLQQEIREQSGQE